MIAEVKGKISSTGSNLNDRLEDKLTGDFFGALRYIPFNKVIKNLLLSTRILKEDSSHVIENIKRLDINYWDKNIQFWPYDYLGELDVLIDFENIVIGIEVKLYSGLSSDDDVDNSNCSCPEESNHQLSRESRILKRKIIGTNKAAFLIFIAPEYSCYPVCKDACDRKIIEDGVILGYLSWEEILVALEKIICTEELNEYQVLILKDLIQLLKRKGLERFRDFNFGCKGVNKDLCFEFKINNGIEVDFTFKQEMIMGDYYEFK